jgi:hypothetical protein
MLPTTPLLVACPQCKSSIFWPTANEIDTYETYDMTGFFDVSLISPENLAIRAEKKAKKLKYQDVARYEQASPEQIFEWSFWIGVRRAGELAKNVAFNRSEH